VQGLVALGESAWRAVALAGRRGVAGGRLLTAANRE
jgi:hypothetical protein